MIKRTFSWMIPTFYKNYWYSKVPNRSRIGVSSHAMPCGLSLHLPSSPKFEQEPLGLLQLPNSTSKILYSGLTCQYVSISAFISDLCHNCHRISIIGVIDVINVRGIQPSVHETPIWLFLSHVSYNSSQIIPMKYMDNYIDIIIHTKTLDFPYIQICKRKISFNIGILASVGLIVSMCLHAPLSLPFSLLFI